jgi:hypothetical protein
MPTSSASLVELDAAAVRHPRRRELIVAYPPPPLLPVELGEAAATHSELTEAAALQLE